MSGNANGVPMGTGPVVGLLLVAKSLTDVDATMLLLRALLLLSGVATLTGTLIASWLIGTRVLRPLSQLVVTARSIAASTARGTRLGNLSQRVPQPRGHDEMAQVVETFNEMLASLESATQAQRRFAMCGTSGRTAVAFLAPAEDRRRTRQRRCGRISTSMEVTRKQRRTTATYFSLWAARRRQMDMV